MFPIRQPARLDEPRAFLANEQHAALIFFRQLNGEPGYLSEPMLRELKAHLSHRSGVDFSLKTFRAAFTRRSVDCGARVDAVARAMRHRST